ncbi:hypothetical protein N8D56_12385 [Devosia sp. A8/3-2]|nr:hypothetical protein N8D56_12385 [Devosia sp. A8/3-2]
MPVTRISSSSGANGSSASSRRPSCSDLIDTLIKGEAHWERFGPDYFLQVPFGLVLCAPGIWSANRRLHVAIPALHIGYQLYWIIKVFNTMT